MGVEQTDETGREERLQAILLAYVEAAEAGRPPDRQRLLVAHPEFAAELADFFAGQDQVDGLAAPLRAVAQAAQLAPLAAADTPPPGPDGTAVLPAAGGAGCFVGAYELLGELGRGGMGVVFEARQKNPNRSVALKMIRAGLLPSEADVQRFRNEGEAAAALDHPGIVPIYEVGEHQGLPYFTMRLVEGESLARRLEAGGPLPPREAARLLAAVAAPSTTPTSAASCTGT